MCPCLITDKSVMKTMTMSSLIETLMMCDVVSSSDISDQVLMDVRPAAEMAQISVSTLAPYVGAVGGTAHVGSGSGDSLRW